MTDCQYNVFEEIRLRRKHHTGHKLFSSYINKAEKAMEEGDDHTALYFVNLIDTLSDLERAKRN